MAPTVEKDLQGMWMQNASEFIKKDYESAAIPKEIEDGMEGIRW